jgi:hypothetical protein
MNLELKVPPVAVGVLTAFAMAAAARCVQLEFALPWRTPLALAIALAGVAVAVAGVVAFRRRRTTVDPRTPERTSAIVKGWPMPVRTRGDGGCRVAARAGVGQASREETAACGARRVAAVLWAFDGCWCDAQPGSEGRAAPMLPSADALQTHGV